MADNILRSYNDAAAVEDVVMNAVEILTAQEEQVANMLGKTEAKDTTHSFLTDTLDTPGTNAQNETGDYSYNAVTTPTRLSNIVQHIRKPFRVSDTQRNVEHYHGRDELERQTEKALRSFGNDLEFNLIRASLTSGQSGTAPQMSGVIEFVSTEAASNVTGHTSGTAWSASILEGMMKLNWDNSNGDVATDLFVGSFLRAETDDFTQKTNVVVGGEQSTIVRTVRTYETAFGTLTIRKHRYVQQSGDATGRALAIRPESMRVAFLERPFIDTDIARTGPFTPRSVNSSVTLELRNPEANWFADGFNIG